MQTFCGLTTDGMLDYLVATYRLRTDHGKVTTSALAGKMHVSPAAASSMLKRLEESSFVTRSIAGGIELTQQGHLAAMQLLRRHRLLEVFLMEVMGFTWDQVDVEAHRLEHSISAAFEDRMDKLCGYPTHCPHGDPIPNKDGVIPKEDLYPLVELKPGDQAVLRRIDTDNASILRYLGKLTLIPGRRVKLIERRPFKGPITLELIGNMDRNYLLGQKDAFHDQEDLSANVVHILGNELAELLFVMLSV